MEQQQREGSPVVRGVRSPVNWVLRIIETVGATNIVLLNLVIAKLGSAMNQWRERVILHSIQ